MGTLWSRVWATNLQWDVGQVLLAVLNPGQTIVRCHFGFRWSGFTSTEQDLSALMEDFMAAGIVTVASTSGSTAPNALTGADDQNPPLERWLWWGTTQLQPRTWDAMSPGVSTWSTDITQLIGDSQGQVKANVAAGQTLNVYASYAPWSSTHWAARGEVQGSLWSSCLTLL